MRNVLGINYFGIFQPTRKEAKGLENRFDVKFMQFGIGLFSHTSSSSCIFELAIKVTGDSLLIHAFAYIIHQRLFG